MAKNFVDDGAQTRDLAFHDGEQQLWQHFSSVFLVKLLFGTIIPSPDLLCPVAIVWSTATLTKTQACFDPNNTDPLLGLQHDATVLCMKGQFGVKVLW